MAKQYGAKVLISAGASAGHLYPALAVARAINRLNQDVEIAFVSSRRNGLEAEIERSGYGLFLISIISLRPGLVRLAKSIYKLFRSLIESFLVIEKFRPDVIIGFGSYVSFPILLEGSFFKKKTIIHEQNVSLGLANRILSLFVDRIALSFVPAGRSSGIIEKKSVFTGYPLRENLGIQDRQSARRFFSLDDKFTILVLGGSQGAHRINMEFKEALGLLKASGDFQFIHITGKDDYQSLRKWYNNIKIRYCVFEFLPEMSFAYSLSDLVISRSGAGAISELAHFGKPAILIPYPHACGHQLENAITLKVQDAAYVIEEKDISPNVLSRGIISLLNSPSRRRDLGCNIQKFAKTDAADSLAGLVLKLSALSS